MVDKVNEAPHSPLVLGALSDEERDEGLDGEQEEADQEEQVPGPPLGRGPDPPEGDQAVQGEHASRDDRGQQRTHANIRVTRHRLFRKVR